MGVLIFDDRDAAIVYSGEWGQAGISEEFNSTTTVTTSEGATATLDFVGTGITVFGTIAGGARTNSPLSRYVIDDSDPVLFQGTPGRAPQRNQAFYQSPTLSPGQHTLTITNMAEGELFLDLMIVTPLEDVLVSTVSVTTTATTVATSGATRFVTVTSGAASSTTPGAGSLPGSAEDVAPSGSSAQATSKSNVGAIAGGIIGAILLLLFVAFGYMIYRKRQQKKRRAPSESFWNSPNVHPAAITPFPPASQPMSPQMAQQGYDSYPSQYQQYPSNQFAPQYPASNSANYPSTSAPSELPYETGDYYSSSQPVQQYAPPSSTMPSSGMGNEGRTRVNLNG